MYHHHHRRRRRQDDNDWLRVRHTRSTLTAGQLARDGCNVWN